MNSEKPSALWFMTGMYAAAIGITPFFMKFTGHPTNINGFGWVLAAFFGAYGIFEVVYQNILMYRRDR